MQLTAHIKQRMSQRGINKEMVNLALDHGVIDGDKYVVDRRQALRRLQEIENERRVLKKILDKGGIEVVVADSALISAYNRNSRHYWK